MDEHKCGDCFHADLCEKSKMFVGFSRGNPAYCGMFLNSAEVAPVQHGQWLHTDYALHWTAKDECSECAYHALDRDDLSHYNYCPNCGAKMDGGAG